MTQNQSSSPAFSFEWLVSAIGMESAHALVNTFGGTAIYVGIGSGARGKRHRAKLVSVLGDKAAETLAAIYGGETLYIPKCRHAALAARDARIKRQFEDRRSGGEGAVSAMQALAQEYQLSDRRVRQILRPLPVPKR